MLQKINENNYKKILPWRNQELVRKNSLDSKIISEDEHDSWWKNVKEDSSKSWLIYKEENIECGVEHRQGYRYRCRGEKRGTFPTHFDKVAHGIKKWVEED